MGLGLDSVAREIESGLVPFPISLPISFLTAPGWQISMAFCWGKRRKN